MGQNPGNNVMTKVWLGAGFTTKQADVKGRAGLRDLTSSRRPTTSIAISFADRAAFGNEAFRPIRLFGVARGEIQQDIRVEAATGHSPRPGRT
jgi:hypothetical protein